MSQKRIGSWVRIPLAIAAAPVMFAGCYHAVINTGVEPGPSAVTEEWAMGYVQGLIPPDSVDGGQLCGENGVARVETRQSFMNQLATVLTLGILSPMEIVVVCGRGAGQDDTGEDARTPRAGT